MDEIEMGDEFGHETEMRWSQEGDNLPYSPGFDMPWLVCFYFMIFLLERLPDHAQSDKMALIYKDF